MIRHRRFPEYLSTIGIDLSDLEWEPRSLSRAAIARMRKHAARIAKIIADDWMEEARRQLAEIGATVAADKFDQARRDQMEAERVANEKESAETQKLIARMIEADLAVLRAEAAQLAKKRRSMNRAVKRERQKLQPKP
jgi:hypothetical protein